VLSRSSQAAVAEPLGEAEGEQHQAEGDAHKRDDEGEPARVGAGSGARVAAEDGDQKDGGENARADHGAAPLEELARAVAGLGSGCVRLWASGHGLI